MFDALRERLSFPFSGLVSAMDTMRFLCSHSLSDHKLCGGEGVHGEHSPKQRDRTVEGLSSLPCHWHLILRILMVTSGGSTCEIKIEQALVCGKAKERYLSLLWFGALFFVVLEGLSCIKSLFEKAPAPLLKLKTFSEFLLLQ